MELNIAECWMMGLEMYEMNKQHLQRMKDMKEKHEKKLHEMKMETALLERQNELEESKLLLSKEIYRFLKFAFDNFEPQRAHDYNLEIKNRVDLTNEETIAQSLRYIDSLLKQYVD